MKVCAEPGCPTLTEHTYCEPHRLDKRKTSDARRPTAKQRGYDQKWRRTRGRYLKHHPTCEHHGCEEPATEVHHRDGRGPNGPDGHKWANLQALCKPHHSHVTALQQPGGWNAEHRGWGATP